MAEQAKLSIEQFSAAIKQRAPELQSVPDDQLVRKVLERRPELINFLQTSEPREPMGSLYEKVGRRIKETTDPRGIADYIGQLGTAINRPPYPHGGGLEATGKSLAETYSKPENVLGDLISAYILNTAEGGPKPFKGPAESVSATALQRFSGAGRDPVLLERIRRQERLAKVEAAYRYRQAETAKGNIERDVEHEANVEKIRAAHQQAVAEARTKFEAKLAEYDQASAEKKAAYAKQVEEARREWVEKTARSRAAERESAKIKSQRETLTRGQNEYGERLRQNLQRTYQTVKSKLDGRWHQLRSTQMGTADKPRILKDEPLDSKHIAETVEKAEKTFLQGAPESLKQFRDLMRFMGAGEEQIFPAPKAEPHPITWDEGRTHYTALGDRIYSGELPRNVYQALQYVREEGLGAELKAAAGRAGALPQYESLLKDWSQFELDWKNTSSVTRGGGSPLAIALKAPNAATLIPQVTGVTGDLLLERLGRYRSQGASPSTAEAIRKLSRDVKNLPKVKIPQAPGRLELPAEPKLGEPPEPPVVRPPELPERPQPKVAKPPRQIPEKTPEEIRRARILSYTSRPQSLYDYLPPRLFVEPLMRNETIREWVAKFPRREYPLPPPPPVAAPPVDVLLDQMFGLKKP